MLIYEQPPPFSARRLPLKALCPPLKPRQPPRTLPPHVSFIYSLTDTSNNNYRTYTHSPIHLIYIQHNQPNYQQYTIKNNKKTIHSLTDTPYMHPTLNEYRTPTSPAASRRRRAASSRTRPSSATSPTSCSACSRTWTRHVAGAIGLCSNIYMICVDGRLTLCLRRVCPCIHPSPAPCNAMHLTLTQTTQQPKYKSNTTRPPPPPKNNNKNTARGRPHALPDRDPLLPGRHRPALPRRRQVHTYTYIHLYIRMCVYMCVCISLSRLVDIRPLVDGISASTPVPPGQSIH